MARKDYAGCCGACADCDLNDCYKFLYSMTFKCARYDRYVKADERGCGRFEPARGRSSEIIEKYDK